MEQLAIPTGRRSRANTGMTEAQLLAAVRQLARYSGHWTYHTNWSKGSEAGWVDLVLLHPGRRRCLFIELKTAIGKVTAAQQMWIDGLTACGFEAGVWRPGDLQHTIPAVLRGQPMNVDGN